MWEESYWEMAVEILLIPNDCPQHWEMVWHVRYWHSCIRRIEILDWSWENFVNFRQLLDTILQPWIFFILEPGVWICLYFIFLSLWCCEPDIERERESANLVSLEELLKSYLQLGKHSHWEGLRKEVLCVIVKLFPNLSFRLICPNICLDYFIGKVWRS